MARAPVVDDDSPDIETCPVARAVALVGDRWSLMIVRDAFDGTRRFGDFQRSLGVARNILSDRLRKLTDAGIFDLQATSDGTAYQEYVLTARGETLFPLVVALRQWGERHLFAKGEKHSTLLDRSTGKPVPYMAPQAADRTVITSARAWVKKVS